MILFFCKTYVGKVQQLNDNKMQSSSKVFAEVDMRSKRHRKLSFRDAATFLL